MTERPPGMPDDTPTYMAPAWVGCLYWAVSEPDVMTTFRAETGLRWEPGKTGIDELIDQATGADRQFIEAFVAWFNLRIWGPLDRPELGG